MSEHDTILLQKNELLIFFSFFLVYFFFCCAVGLCTLRVQCHWVQRGLAGDLNAWSASSLRGAVGGVFVNCIIEFSCEFF